MRLALEQMASKTGAAGVSWIHFFAKPALDKENHPATLARSLPLAAQNKVRFSTRSISYTSAARNGKCYELHGESSSQFEQAGEVIHLFRSAPDRRNYERLPGPDLEQIHPPFPGAEHCLATLTHCKIIFSVVPTLNWGQPLSFPGCRQETHRFCCELSLPSPFPARRTNLGRCFSHFRDNHSLDH